MKKHMPDGVVGFFGVEAAVHLPGQGEVDRAGLNLFRDTLDHPFQQAFFNIGDFHALILVRGEFRTLEASVADDFLHVIALKCIKYTTIISDRQACWGRG